MSQTPGKNKVTFKLKLHRDYWIDYDEVRLHQRFHNLLMQGYSSQQVKEIIDNEEASKPISK